MEGIAYQKLAAQKGAQAAEVQSYHQERFLEAADRILEVNQLADDLRFKSVTPDKFEAAIDDVARFIGLHSQRPEKQFNDGPDNLWALPHGSFLVIECKKQRDIRERHFENRSRAARPGDVMVLWKVPKSRGRHARHHSSAANARRRVTVRCDRSAVFPL